MFLETQGHGPERLPRTEPVVIPENARDAQLGPLIAPSLNTRHEAAVYIRDLGSDRIVGIREAWLGVAARDVSAGVCRFFRRHTV